MRLYPEQQKRNSNQQLKQQQQETCAIVAACIGATAAIVGASVSLHNATKSAKLQQEGLNQQESSAQTTAANQTNYNTGVLDQANSNAINAQDTNLYNAQYAAELQGAATSVSAQNAAAAKSNLIRDAVIAGCVLVAGVVTYEITKD